MAQFDAGSIVGTLDLDRDPYSLGLDLARRQAEDFENKKISPVVGITDAEAKEKLDVIRAKIAEISDDGIHVRVGLFGNEEAQAQLDDLIAKESEAAKQVDVKIDVQGAPEAVAELESVKKAADHASGFDGGGGGMSKLIMLALALAPALAPIGAVGGAGLVAFAGGITQAVAALGPFALVAKGDFTDMTTATKNLAKAQADLESATTTAQKAKAIKELADAEKTLAGPMGQAATAYGLVSAAVKKLKEDTAGPVFGVMTQAFQLAAELLPKLEPVIVASATGIGNMLGIFKEAFEGPTFSKFLTLITNNIAPDLTLLARTLVNFGRGFANMIIGLDPITHKIYDWIHKLSEDFSKWTTDGGFEGFLRYVNREAGPVGGLLSAIWGALKNIVTVAAPFGELLLGPLTTFFKVIAGVDLAPMSKALGDLVNAVSPVLPALGQIVNDILPGFTPLLEAIVPLVANLANAFADLVRDLPPEFVRDLGLLAGAFWVLNAAMDANPAMLAAVAFGLLVAALPRSWAEVLIAIAGAIWLVNIALDADPIVLIALAFVALGFGLFQLVKHFKAVSDFLHGPWGTALSVAVSFLLPMVGIAMLLIGHWKEVWSVLKMIGSFFVTWAKLFVKNGEKIVHFFEKIPGFFERIWHDVYGFFAKYGEDIGIWILRIALWPLTIYKHWDEIVGFFEGIGSSIWNTITRWFGNTLTWIEDTWDKVVDFLGKLPGRIISFFEKAPGWLLQAGKDIISGLLSGLVTMFDNVVTWFSNMPGVVLMWLGDLGSWLFDAGKQVLQGLWHGLQQGFEDIKDGITGLAGKVTGLFKSAWNVLSPSRVFMGIGGNLMAGLHIGLSDVYHNSVKPLITKIADDLTDSFNPSLATSGINTPASAAIAGQTAALTAVAVGIDGLRSDIRALPDATGEAVGSNVGSKFKEATDAQTRKLTTVGRTG